MTDLKTIAAECASRIMDRMEMCRGSAILKGDIEREVEMTLAQVTAAAEPEEVRWFRLSVGGPEGTLTKTVPVEPDPHPVAVECKPGVLELHYEDAAGSHIFSSYADLDAYIAQRDGPYPKTTFDDWLAYVEAKRRGEVLPTPGGYPDLSSGFPSRIANGRP
jgi:hypothetical protein